MRPSTENKIVNIAIAIFFIMFITIIVRDQILDHKAEVALTEPTEITMTVDEFVSLPGDFYYIVKAEGDFGVLESDVYMDREVVEVAVCDDTENTICLFIQLEENENNAKISKIFAHTKKNKQILQRKSFLQSSSPIRHHRLHNIKTPPV